MGLIFNLS